MIFIKQFFTGFYEDFSLSGNVDQSHVRFVKKIDTPSIFFFEIQRQSVNGISFSCRQNKGLCAF